MLRKDKYIVSYKYKSIMPYKNKSIVLYRWPITSL
jgi:hypothetical protein